MIDAVMDVQPAGCRTDERSYVDDIMLLVQQEDKDMSEAKFIEHVEALVTDTADSLETFNLKLGHGKGVKDGIILTGCSKKNQYVEGVGYLDETETFKYLGIDVGNTLIDTEKSVIDKCAELMRDKKP